jgi:hypothetical protein
MPGTQQFNETYPVAFLYVATSGVGTSPFQLGPNVVSYWRADTFTIRNTDAIDHVMSVGITDGSTVVNLGDVTIPTGAGTGVIPLFDVLLALGAPYTAGVVFPWQGAWQFQLAVAVGGGAELDMYFTGGNL